MKKDVRKESEKESTNMKRPSYILKSIDKIVAEIDELSDE